MSRDVYKRQDGMFGGISDFYRFFLIVVSLRSIRQQICEASQMA